ncbi:uncharacterized protein DEA37_0004155, partial [Paragonimus westermani]
KPFSTGQRIRKSEVLFWDICHYHVTQWFQIARFSFFRLILDSLWIEGLYLCGPFRFVLLFEHSELLILAAVSTVVYGASTTSKVIVVRKFLLFVKTRGTIFFILGVTSVALFDHDTHHEGSFHRILYDLWPILYSVSSLADFSVFTTVSAGTDSLLVRNAADWLCTAKQLALVW